jgi:AcrR family transcriptional regulator
MKLAKKRWTAGIQDRDEQRKLKRTAVVKAGARLFHSRGYEYTSLNEIAEDLGVSKPSLYYYVKSKEDILNECIQQGLEMASAAFGQAEMNGKNGHDKVLIFFEKYLDSLFDDVGQCSSTVDIRGLNQDLAEQIRKTRSQIDHRIRSFVEEGMKDGSIPAADPVLTTFFLFGAYNWIGNWFRADESKSREEVEKAFLESTRRLLKP